MANYTSNPVFTVSKLPNSSWPVYSFIFLIQCCNLFKDSCVNKLVNLKLQIALNSPIAYEHLFSEKKNKTKIRSS